MSVPFPFSHIPGIRLVNSTELYPALHQQGDTGLPLLVVENSFGRAVIALQGAHVMSFQPAGERDMLWMSPKSWMIAGKPIRGGIPLCLPWFGPASDGGTQHGFARLLEWSPVSADVLADGATRVVLELTGDETVHPLWPHAFRFRLAVTVGSALGLEFTAEHKSAEPAPFAFAYHTYFAVPDVAKARVGELEGVTYIDRMNDSVRKVQQGDVSINAHTVHVYLDVPKTQILKSSAGDVKIESDTSCAVVWNAWTDDVKMPDLGEGNHVGYICVERGDVADRAITLQPGGQYKAGMTLSY